MMLQHRSPRRRFQGKKVYLFTYHPVCLFARTFSVNACSALVSHWAFEGATQCGQFRSDFKMAKNHTLVVTGPTPRRWGPRYGRAPIWVFALSSRSRALPGVGSSSGRVDAATLREYGRPSCSSVCESSTHGPSR